jgi:hypothetical protein|tara:strand:+ start:141 stop:320 length:180 start_codon:yes stop_codon:yes gene_type:complete
MSIVNEIVKLEQIILENENYIIEGGLSLDRQIKCLDNVVKYSKKLRELNKEFMKINNRI